MHDLGTLSGSGESVANGVNSDGSVVVGESHSDNGYRAFRWVDDGSPTGKMQSVEDWLRENGVTIGSDITGIARAVNADGSVVVGSTVSSTAFLARVTSTGSGLIDIDQYRESLRHGGMAASLSGLQADLALNGAHSMPLRGLLSEGQSGMWVTGDLGRKDHNAWDATQGLGEIGYSYGISPDLQIGLAIGKDFSRHKFDLGGRLNHNGVYVLPEVIWRAQGNLYLSVSGYYNDGHAKIRRGYMNAGALDSSSGKADVKSWGGRLRADWLNAANVLDTALTPNISYTYTKTKRDAYTEKSGGFPVAWDGQTEDTNIIRLGLDAVHPVTPELKLLGRVEGAYRFEERGDDVGGQIIGLNSFSFDGNDHDQFWIRGGIGAEADLQHGTASVMLNASTSGGSSDYWLSTTYRVKF